MIHDPIRLQEVIEEISDWTLQQRRDYIGEIEKVFGEESAQQIKDGLTGYWKRK